MKFSDGFTRLWPSVATIVCYCTAFYLLAQTLSTIPTGIAYAIWSGAGIVLISLLGWLVSGQKLDFPAIAGMFLICAGVLFFKIFPALILKECRISGAVSRAYPCAVKKPAWYEAGLRIFVVIRTGRLNQRQRCRQLRYHCFHRSCRLRPAG